MSFELTPKSTPLSNTSCPRKARSVDLGEEHIVAETDDNEYTCSCGQVFAWEDQFHWETAPVIA